MGWLEREERRGYLVGQFWYLISADWWQQWLNYTSAPRYPNEKLQLNIYFNVRTFSERTWIIVSAVPNREAW